MALVQAEAAQHILRMGVEQRQRRAQVRLSKVLAAVAVARRKAPQVAGLWRQMVHRSRAHKPHAAGAAAHKPALQQLRLRIDYRNAAIAGCEQRGKIAALQPSSNDDPFIFLHFAPRKYGGYDKYMQNTRERGSLFMNGKYTKAAIKIVWRTSAAFCIFAFALFGGCRAPQNSNLVLYLYVSEHNEQTFREIFTAASAAARKYGAKLVVKNLGELQNLDKLLANEKNEPTEPTNPAIGLVLYPSDWSAQLRAQLTALQRQSAKSQNAETTTLKKNKNYQLLISVWLLSRNMDVKELLTPEMQNQFDAISSPSATRPAKAAAKKFFSGLLQRSD